MNKRIKKLLVILLCVILTAGYVTEFSPDVLAKPANVYTFGNVDGTWRDLAKEHEAEKQRKAVQKAAQEESERIKAEQLKKIASAKKPVKITRRPVKTCPKE